MYYEKNWWRCIIFRYNSNSRYYEGDPILHVKEIVDSPIYNRRDKSSDVQSNVYEDKSVPDNSNFDDLDDVKGDFYTASKKNFIDSQKVHYDYANYHKNRHNG